MMGRPRKEPKSEVPAKDTKLEGILKDLRNNKTDAVRLVEYLEGNSYKESEHTEEFCEAYAIAIIQTHCKDTTREDVDQAGGGIAGSAEDKAELMLAACGFLQGFTYERQGQRNHKYYDYARTYNQLLSGTWHGESSITAKLRPILNDITWELTNTLFDIKTQRVDKKLGFLNQVPKELTLPAPHNAKPTKEPITPEPTGLRLIRLLKQFIIDTKNTLIEGPRPKISLVAILAISAFVGFLLLARIILGSLSKETPINNIYIVNDQISLLPGEREKLMVAIYPNDANIELLEYVSDNANVAYIVRSDKDRYVVALDDWQADAVHQATITVQYEEATDTASVTVQEPTLTSLETQTGIGENQSTDGSGENKEGG